MSNVINLDIIQTTFLSLVQSVGLTKDMIMSEIDENSQCRWSINHNVSINSYFSKDLRELVSLFEFSTKAKISADDLTALCALMRAGLRAHILHNLFEDIWSDVDKVLYRDERFSWPPIPDGYQIPHHFLMAGADARKRMAAPGVTANPAVLTLWENATGEVGAIEKERIDVIRKTFMALAESIGISCEKMDNKIGESDQFEWCIDYADLLGERLEKDLNELLLFFEVHRIAILNNDQLAAYVALMNAGIYAQTVSNFFLNIKDKVDEVTIFDKRFSWPIIPDSYKFPEHLVTNLCC
ncbi:hypothetical protein [Herbaspirillum seropedicae]|uniref:hypothetical protein n=1 Tax=Herbaspirillum seropedicae TaxID=964 RepID=UPI003FCD012C